VKFAGYIHRFGDHIDTDVIIPSNLLTRSEPESLAKGCFAAVYPEFRDRVKPGDLIFAGENFGCGSSREHAPIAIKATGISCVVAASFARIFYRSAINIGLPVVACPEAIPHAVAGKEAEVDLSAGYVLLEGRRFAVPQFSKEVLSILRLGGLVPFMAQRLNAMGGREGQS
jgi:3-isopropylmalate/(R)-2-methylmalate dehydratase small subunit